MTQVRSMRADARRNYERLLKVAAEAFAEHGEGASLDDIAKRAGVGSGTLYRHFPTRQALLEAAYVDRVEGFARRADELAEALPPGEALAEWLYELCVGTIQVRGLKTLLGSAVADGSDAVLTVCGTHVRGRPRGWCRRRGRRGRCGRMSSRSSCSGWHTGSSVRRSWRTAGASPSGGTCHCSRRACGRRAPMEVPRRVILRCGADTGA